MVGVAVNVRQSSEVDTASVKIIKKHFNSIVAEDCMKSANIHPEEDRYNFEQADQFVKFGQENNMAIIGHCLIWHSQLAPWFCVDQKGNNVSAEVLKQRMKDHITTIVTRYKGKSKDGTSLMKPLKKTAPIVKPNSMKYWAKNIFPSLSNMPTKLTPMLSYITTITE